MRYPLAPDCSLCSLRSDCTQVVWGHGPSDLSTALFMLIAEAPGENEDRQGEPLIGKTGDETQWLLARNGISWDLVYRTNVVKCRPYSNRDPKPTEISACSSWLEQELEMVRPKIIVAMGRFATQWFLPFTNMEMLNGIPFQDEVGRIIIPVYHVAAGLHNPSTMLQIQAGFQTVRDVLAGKRPTRHIEDEFKGQERYFELRDEDLL